jgi:hypothetical protein
MTETTIQSAPDIMYTLIEDSYVKVLRDWMPSIIGFLSLGLAFFVHWKTTRYRKYFERPVISIDSTSAGIERGNFEGNCKFRYPFVVNFHNQGEHPASDINLKFYYLYPNDSTAEATFKTPNNLYQDKKSNIKSEWLASEEITSEKQIFIALKIQYKNLLNTEDRYEEWHWYKFQGGKALPHPSIEEKELMIKKLKEKNYIS